MTWLREREQAAAQKVLAEMAKPLPADNEDIGDRAFFDPWEIFPCLFGSYSKEFDDMALLVLRNIHLADECRWDEQVPEALEHHMFREILCTSDLCDYGTSPRTCFATSAFAEVLPTFIERWREWSDIHWGTANSGL